MQKKILICTYSSFPNMSATATRIDEIIYILEKYSNITIITMDLIENSSSLYLNHKKYNFRKYTSGHPLSFYNYLTYFNKLKKVLNTEEYDVIIDCGVPFHCFLYLKKYCIKRSKIFVSDVLDWFSYSQFSFKFLSIIYWLNEIKLRYIIDQKVKIIAISSYLTQYFENKGIDVFYLPFTMRGTSFMNFDKVINDEVINFIYAGKPQNKDLLYPFWDAMSLLPTDKLLRVKFYLFGLDDNYISLYKKKNVASYNKIKNNLIIHGVVERNKILQFYKNATFSVLLRNPAKKFAKAGFPTKITESLFTQTPVFCNITSNIDDYLTNGLNSVIVSSPTKEDCLDNLLKILELDKQELLDMSLCAYKTANKNLATDNYSQDLIKFVLNIN